MKVRLQGGRIGRSHPGKYLAVRQFKQSRQSGNPRKTTGRNLGRQNPTARSNVFGKRGPLPAYPTGVAPTSGHSAARSPDGWTVENPRFRAGPAPELGGPSAHPERPFTRIQGIGAGFILPNPPKRGLVAGHRVDQVTTRQSIRDWRVGGARGRPVERYLIGPRWPWPCAGPRARQKQDQRLCIWPDPANAPLSGALCEGLFRGVEKMQGGRLKGPRKSVRSPPVPPVHQSFPSNFNRRVPRQLTRGCARAPIRAAICHRAKPSSNP